MDLFPTLFNKLSRQGGLKPVFLGQFEGVETLEKIDYPPIYYWIDITRGVMILWFNEPLLRKVCYSEAFDSGLVGDMSEEVMSAINLALEKLKSVTQSSFVKSLEAGPVGRGVKIKQAPSIFLGLECHC